MLNCPVDHILQEFYTLFLARSEPTKFRHHPKQITSKADFKGLVSLSSFVYGANALLGPVGEEGALDTPGPLNVIERSECHLGPSNAFALMKSIIHRAIRTIGQ